MKNNSNILEKIDDFGSIFKDGILSIGLIFILICAALLMELIGPASASIIFLIATNLFFGLILYLCVIKLDWLRVHHIQKRYQLSRIYDKNGNEVRNRFVDFIEDGYWVTIIYDPLEDKTYVEHTRTESNQNKYPFEERILQEHRYNHLNVWGESYKGRKSFQGIIVNSGFSGERFYDRMKRKNQQK